MQSQQNNILKSGQNLELTILEIFNFNAWVSKMRGAKGEKCYMEEWKSSKIGKTNLLPINILQNWNIYR